MFWCLLSSLILGFAGLLLFIYYLYKGQFDDPEDVKYEMFRDEKTNEKTNEKANEKANEKD